MNRPTRFALFLFAAVGVIIACDPKDDILGPLSPTVSDGLDSIEYNPQAYQFPPINGLPTMQIPASNPVTVQGVKLGRYLFYEKILLKSAYHY